MSYYSTNTGTYAPAQDGHRNPIFLVWSEANVGMLMTPSASANAGMVFQLLTSFDSERGLPLNPPTFLTATLALTRTGAAAAGTLNLYLVPSPLPDLFSTSNLPSATGNILIASATVGASSNISLTINMSLVRPYSTHGTWRGRLAMPLVWVPDDGVSTLLVGSSESVTASERPILTTTEVPFETGIVTPDVHRPGRIRNCPRMGTPHFADEFVDDGYVEGLKVFHEAFDPEDRADDYYLPTNEGRVNDDIP